MPTITLKNGVDVLIREGVREDAQSIIDFYNEVGGETHFLSFGKDEYKISLEEQENAIGLYKKVGFEVESILKKECYYNGVYTDLIGMSLLLGI
ncbi:hypothetical protein QVA99_00375 [Clostridioides difficile]|uniref:hypothetical protein n=1 Tax=Clostridioides difficile TaxID=1496 RepID=UPI001C1774AB|nr:hypothetical protein [Clostridioides difficile]KAK2243110.1 hypothetical protein XC29_05330 [Clostridioides difficile]MDM9956900.1 hypothetical protein [Clostridioides difficile]HBG5736679.1 hypothetical protein [Clostridioides difficile]